ncbi:hypothetical protein [uncultured Cyclobacterium sp.]|uniref:hypothetical protein n=1 Tax=uncultured Cyclobacterium sp. TaxID=453820 RepID=UPI0030EB7AF5|tara:strand:- start:17745 stop:18953 length:1209 start_codon:yes stop_codon:yes gene_type:complete
MNTPSMKILFITWDSDQTNYLENLFFPIFTGLQKKVKCEFYVLQFSWADAAEVERISNLAIQLNITYVHHPAWRKPHPVIGSFLTTLKGRKAIKKLVQSYGITHQMPRSTMPAMMVNPILGWLKERGVKTIFDADGFPLQERIDYSGLKQNSLQYKWFKHVENKLLKRSNIILVRSELAKEIHLKNIGNQYKNKIFVVSNGRNKAFFKPDLVLRERFRKELSLNPSTVLWLYSGSLGPQYQLSEMLRLFENYHSRNPYSKFLFLVRDEAALKSAIPAHLKACIIIKSVAFNLLPAYYAAADLGISLRKSAPSLAGIAPIKVSEYLLSGLPILLSAGIGDLEKSIGSERFCFMHHDYGEERFFNWLTAAKNISREEIRSKAIPLFDLENSLKEYDLAIKATNE